MKKIDIIKLANAIRVGIDEMTTITSKGHGEGKYEIMLLDDKMTIEVKNIRMNTTTYTTLFNCIYYQCPSPEAKAGAKKLAVNI